MTTPTLFQLAEQALAISVVAAVQNHDIDDYLRPEGNDTTPLLHLELPADIYFVDRPVEILPTGEVDVLSEPGHDGTPATMYRLKLQLPNATAPLPADENDFARTEQEREILRRYRAIRDPAQVATLMRVLEAFSTPVPAEV